MIRPTFKSTGLELNLYKVADIFDVDNHRFVETVQSILKDSVSERINGQKTDHIEPIETTKGEKLVKVHFEENSITVSFADENSLLEFKHLEFRIS